MEPVRDEFAEPPILGVVAVLYSAILLAAFVIGLYGLFSLAWMASRAVEQSARTLG